MAILLSTEQGLQIVYPLELVFLHIGNRCEAELSQGHMTITLLFFFERYFYCFLWWLNKMVLPPSLDKWKKVLFLTQTLAVFRLSIFATLTNMRWYLKVVLICIFLIMNADEYFVVYILAISMSSLEKSVNLLVPCLGGSVGIFAVELNECFIFCHY